MENCGCYYTYKENDKNNIANRRNKLLEELLELNAYPLGVN